MASTWHYRLGKSLRFLRLFAKWKGWFQGAHFYSRKDQRWFSLCIFRDATWPEFNFAVIENCMYLPKCGRPSTACQRPSTFRKVHTVFKLSNLSFAYLHRFSHFIRFCLLSMQGKRKEKSRGWSLRRGRVSKIDPSRFLTPSLGGLPCLGPGSQIWKGLFSDPSPVRNTLLQNFVSSNVQCL